MYVCDHQHLGCVHGLQVPDLLRFNHELDTFPLVTKLDLPDLLSQDCCGPLGITILLFPLSLHISLIEGSQILDLTKRMSCV